MVASQRDDQGRSQAPGKLNQDRIRRRVTTNVYGSARRLLRAQLNTGNMAAVHRPDFVNRARIRLVADPRMKRAPNEKECRAPTLSRRRPVTNTSSSNSSNSSNEAARLHQPIMPRVMGNRKVETRDNQKKRRRQGRINFGATTPAALERETPGPPLLNPLPLVGRLCQTPIHLFVIGKTFLIRPLFPVRGQTSANRILSNVVHFS